ncbi:unnamed protein product [Sphenostylis stenocarpa]|uniref:TIR domain-containing protein n=1 Tax=Sphenostylis stenocarpa TaxID=92480 RepID=A0AA86SLK4_9FABA|nr:unnamed protein product [Sphenostylis stenocarpa]
MCRVAIVVFTKNYAESAWCLHELQQIIKWHETYCRHVLPVYYEIQPSDVRLQKGDFGNALKATAQQTFSGQQAEDALSRWSRALTKAANLFGWDESNYRSDAELVDKIVKNILYLPILSATKFPVGLQSHVENVMRMIENKSTEVSVIGIWGEGGLGKTTLVKAVYNQIQGTFMYKSFIEDVTEICQRGHVHFQEKLISHVLKTKVEIKSHAMDKTTIQERFSGKRVLIVLNDANPFHPLEYLCRNSKWFGQGTVIIISTSDVSLLDESSVKYIYKMSNMNENDSLELFSWHAFREEKPIEDFNELARDVVAYCGGLPLVLEVLGSYLSERTKKEWKSVLSKLKLIPSDQVKEKLRISFDGLRGGMEKDIFLDVCCFFIGKDRGYVTEILNGCGLDADTGIAVLIERSLLKVEKSNKLGVHHLLREMGREIIHRSSTKERQNRNRLFTDDARFVLTENNGTEAIQGLILKLPLAMTSWLEICAFQNKQILRVPDLDSLLFTGDYPNLSKQLSNLRRVWKQPRVLGLKFLNLSHTRYLTETPDFSRLPSLEQLILKDCPSLCKIHILEKDIVKIESLITLIAENKAVKQVPLSIVSSKCIGYVSLRGFEGLSHKIYPSIIRSWISHNIRPFSTHMENNNWRDLSPLFSSLANLRSVLVQCDTEFQLSKQVRTTLVECGANVTKLRTSEHHLRFSLIGVGSYNEFFNTLSDSIHEGLARSESSYVCLPGNNHPHWLAHVGEGHSVCFTMPQDCDVKGMALCVVYLSTPDNLATECLTSVLIVNYTKCTFHIHKHGTVISFDDRDWEGIMSNLGSGDKVEIFVTLAHGLVVKNTAVYLIYGDPNELEMEACHQPNKNVLHQFLKEIVTCDFK